MCAAEVHNSFSYIVANMSLVIIEERGVSILLFFVLLFVAYHIYNMNLHEVFSPQLTFTTQNSTLRGNSRGQ